MSNLVIPDVSTKYSAFGTTNITGVYTERTKLHTAIKKYMEEVCLDYLSVPEIVQLFATTRISEEADTVAKIGKVDVSKDLVLLRSDLDTLITTIAQKILSLSANKCVDIPIIISKFNTSSLFLKLYSKRDIASLRKKVKELY